jgi:hypothetical protein
MRRTVPGEPHHLVAPGMRAALPSGAVGDADAALHSTIVTFLMRALAIYMLALWGVVGRGTRHAQHGECAHNIALV